MTEIKAAELLERLKMAELTGAYKALHWLLFNIYNGDKIHERATPEDIGDYIHYGMVCINEQIVNDFKEKAFVLTDFGELVKRRRKEKEGEKDE